MIQIVSRRKPCVKKSPLVDTDGLPVESVNDDDHNDDDISNESSKQKPNKSKNHSKCLV